VRFAIAAPGGRDRVCRGYPGLLGDSRGVVKLDSKVTAHLKDCGVQLQTLDRPLRRKFQLGPDRPELADSGLYANGNCRPKAGKPRARKLPLIWPRWQPEADIHAKASVVTRAGPLPRKSISRTSNRRQAIVHNMRVDHGRLNILVPHQFLDHSNIVAGLQEVRRKGVPEGMTTDRFVDSRAARRPLDGTLQRLFVDVETHPSSRVRIAAVLKRGKHELPTPQQAGLRILAGECQWQRRLTPSLFDVRGVQGLDLV